MANKRSEGPITVLIVEDEPLLLLYAEDFLTEAGFKTLTAPNADDAIAILERIAEIHIIFTDVQMPGSMDGLDLAEAVRDRWPPIAIVVTSGQLLSAPDLPTNSRYFSKPFQSQHIVNAMREMVA